jgi:hypothetical protein
MGVKVAVDGEATATPSATPATGADSGKWTAGEITYTSYPKLKVGGTKVIWKASCTFSFDGKSGNTPKKASETVTLTATAKKLNKSQNAVLVSGDTKTGPEGNTISVTAAGKLLS